MERPPVSIVIPVWNAWPFTKLCLETLRPTVGVRDEIIVVDNGSTDATSKELRSQSGIQVITNSENLGFAKANNQGAAIAKNDILVFLNNDTAVPRGWLEELVAPFVDETVGATGPRTNHSSGSQIVDPVPYRETRSMGDFREFARDWMRDHRGETKETDRLVGFCVAVRKTAFDQIGGWDEQYKIGGFEDDDLSTSLIKLGWKLLVCDGSFIHHHGSRTFQENKVDQYGIQKQNETKYLDKHAQSALVSACLIVKDEEENIRYCIESLQGFVDEVVVYDTGSVDRTVQIAREMGAKVSMGFWNDDFSRARNTALKECTGKWILHVDADERLELAELGELRSQLLRDGQTPLVLVVPINNVDDAFAGGDVEHFAARLFTRTDYKWEGRLHEKLVRVDGTPITNKSLAPSIRLQHFGYTTDAISRRKKVERNIRLARADLEDTSGNTAYKVFNLGRSLMMARENLEALDLFTVALSGGEQMAPKLRRDMLRSGIEAQLDSGDFKGAYEWVDTLETSEPEDPSVVHYLRAQALFGLSDFDAASREFELVEYEGAEAKSYSQSTLLFRKGICYKEAGEYAKAFEALLSAAELGYRGQIWPTIIELAADTQSTNELLESIANNDKEMIHRQVAMVNPAAADTLAELYWNSPDMQQETLAFASLFAHKLSHMRGLEWSKRFREDNLQEKCPLIALSSDATRDGTQRIQAAAMARSIFGDVRGEPNVRAAATKVNDRDLVPVLAQLLQIAPTFVQPFLEGAATTSKRSLYLAKAMEEAGAASVAIELRNHAATLPNFASLDETQSSEESNSSY